jgi:RimJ/RimL family protein N-acetyltransferase
MPAAVFATERLSARLWTEAEVEPILAVYGDGDAMRWVGDGVALTREQCEKWLEVTRTNYEKRGYGMFALVEKESGRVVGFCGLVHPGGQEEPEVKYAFLRSHWGRGLATEAVIGLIEYGRTTHSLRHIIATTAPANSASHRVLLKAGLVHGPLRCNEDGSKTQVFIWQHAPSAA